MNIQELMDKLARAISFKFKDDATCPGLTISKLRHGYYCSVVRYPTGKGKTVVCKVTANDLTDALKGVTKEFLKVAQPQPDPIKELQDLSAEDD